MRKTKAIPELSAARELATITCILAETQRQAEEWENLVVEERDGFSVPDSRLWAWGSWRWGN